ncbi:MAG: hypothetical protein ABJE95_11740, partial [Byssovorax sp.]
MARYYFAGGARKALKSAVSLLAIDTSRAGDAGLGDQVTALHVTSRLTHGLVLVKRTDCPPSLLTSLKAAGALRSVFRAGKVVVVPLPEVRVEWDGGERAAVHRAVRDSGVPA